MKSFLETSSRVVLSAYDSNFKDFQFGEGDIMEEHCKTSHLYQFRVIYHRSVLAFMSTSCCCVSYNIQFIY